MTFYFNVMRSVFVDIFFGERVFAGTVWVESTHTIWLWALLGVSIALLLLGICLYRMFYKATRPKRPSSSSVPAARVNVVVGTEAKRQPFQAFNKKRTV